MGQIKTEILVIGGGATGGGVLRDLAMRGFKTILVEKGDLTHGTTGRYHGLLHSGGRYVIKDPQTARECIEENRILRKIMPHCIEDTGGFFVTTLWDDPDYPPLFLAGCQQAGIPVEEITIPQMLRAEPLLNPQISHCFRVPDASADSFLGTDANVESAKAYGAQVFTYHPVERLVQAHGRVVGAVCRDLVKDEEVHFEADLVINASGAWAGKIAATIGVQVQIRPGKGVMLAINHRVVHTVINRCKMPSDGDILVPAHTVAVIGTTDVQVADPDHFAIEPWEVDLMLSEGEKLIPGLRQMRILRAWAGVRPLYQGGETHESRDITRAYVLLDHEPRDGVAGLLTITSGKWTTYRRMAEATADQACQKLGVSRPCRTHLEELPAATGQQYHSLGARLSQIEQEKSYGQLICECELATYADVQKAITLGEAKTIDDIRRDTRLGMGPCQGAFCTFRAAGMLHELRSPEGDPAGTTAVEEINVALRDFLQERWKGLRPILWGQQLRQQRLNELIYRTVLNIEALPGPASSRLGAENYAQLEAGLGLETLPSDIAAERSRSLERSRSPAAPKPFDYAQGQPDAVVIGAGLAGLFAAWLMSQRGLKVRVIAKGWGATHWASGCIDVFHTPPGSDHNLFAFLAKWVQDHPAHPYALAGIENLQASLQRPLQAFQQLCQQAGYPLEGSLEQNWRLPTALGSLRATCLAPVTMTAGHTPPDDAPSPVLLVGFGGFYDFYPRLAAANLNAQGIPASAITLELPALQKQRFVTGRVLAELFDTAEFSQAVVQALTPRLPASLRLRVGFPAVLGLKHAVQTWQGLQNGLGCPVFEMPSLPPSLPGIRLHRLLWQAIESAGGRVFDGMQAQGAAAWEGNLTAVLSEAAARSKAHYGRSFLLATGGFLGGGLSASQEGQVVETALGLPLNPMSPHERFQQNFLAQEGQLIFKTGIKVNRSFQPVGTENQPLYPNLYAAGAILADCDPLVERSLEGIALASAWAAVENLCKKFNFSYI